MGHYTLQKDSLFLHRGEVLVQIGALNKIGYFSLYIVYGQVFSVIFFYMKRRSKEKESQSLTVQGLSR